MTPDALTGRHHRSQLRLAHQLGAHGFVLDQPRSTLLADRSRPAPARRSPASASFVRAKPMRSSTRAISFSIRWRSAAGSTTTASST
jgi:hypothetical protein